jgi:hypothetical protein
MIKTGKTATEKIFENIIFLADVFGEQLEERYSGVAGVGDGTLF